MVNVSPAGERNADSHLKGIAMMKQTLAITMIVTIGWASAAQAAVVTWGTPTSITAANGDPIVDTTGTLIEARNLGDTTNHTVNGVLFTAQLGRHGMGNHDSSLVYNHTQGTATFEAMMDSFSFSNTAVNGALTFTLSGLTSGNDYLLQFLVSDDRTAGLQNNGTTFEATNTSSAVRHGSSQSIIGTFTADGTTQNITVTGWDDYTATGPTDTQSALSINAFQVRETAVNDVPTPAALPAGLALIGLFAVRRRRR